MKKRAPGCFFGYLRDETLPSEKRGYFINHEIRIPSLTNQDGSWKVRPFFFFVAHLKSDQFHRFFFWFLVIYLRGTPWKSSKGSAVRRKKLLMISSHRCRLRCVLPAAQAEYRQVTFTYCTISNVEGFRFQGSEGYIEGLKVERLKGATMGHLQFCGAPSRTTLEKRRPVMKLVAASASKSCQLIQGGPRKTNDTSGVTWGP